jgi:hypothetical protein
MRIRNYPPRKRLCHRLRSSSVSPTRSSSGHDFSRAVKENQNRAASAAEGRILQLWQQQPYSNWRSCSPRISRRANCRLCMDFKGANLILDRGFLLIPHEALSHHTRPVIPSKHLSMHPYRHRRPYPDLSSRAESEGSALSSAKSLNDSLISADRKQLRGDFKRTNLILDLSSHLIPYDSQIKLQLKIKPKIGSRSQRISEPKSHLRRDTSLLLHNVVDAWSGNVQSQCKPISVQAKRHHKLFSKNLARMNWFQSSHDLVDVVLLPMQCGVGLDDDAFLGPLLQLFHQFGFAGL